MRKEIKQKLMFSIKGFFKVCKLHNKKKWKEAIFELYFCELKKGGEMKLSLAYILFLPLAFSGPALVEEERKK